MKKILSFLFCILIAFTASAGSHSVSVGASPLLAKIGLAFVGVGFGAVLTELWTGELIKKFRFVGQWLASVPSEDKYVNNNVIHLADVGADPSVLIDNTSYPIASSTRTDSDIALALKKFDTTNTKITADELYALPYDKPGSVIEQHRLVLEESTAQYGLYSLAPAATGANTPFIATTGADNGSSRKRLTVLDVANAKTAMDNLKVPLKGRILVLCNDHVNDLLTIDQSFRDRYFNTATGQIMNFMGFEIHQDVYNPIYDASGNKRAWGATAAPSTDRNSSIFFYAPRTFQAKGTVEMFYKDKSIDPDNRETKVGFRLYHIVLPKKNTGFGAITSTIIP